LTVVGVAAGSTILKAKNGSKEVYAIVTVSA
jgi:hypothetical protein